ncbi:MAG: ABC transporter permease [Isosphaeraceae bacterium]|nr:ABC transporter permease [Isosphaeraceae bacterium]
MFRIAFKMLLHDQAKYLALVLGISFATLLISQQSAIFHSLLLSSARDLSEVDQAEIWVMKPTVETFDESDSMSELTVSRVRSVPGVEWAVPYYQSTSRLKTEKGRIKVVQVIGIDDSSMVAAPRRMLMGSVTDLLRPDAIIVDASGFKAIFPDQELRTGIRVEVGECRGVIVGICHLGPSWSGMPRIYARRSLAVRMARETLNPVTYVLVRTRGNLLPNDVCREIERRTSLTARTRSEFADATIGWILKYSGVAENFGITILLGVVIGVAIVGQTFYMFSLENLKQFATLKAIGLKNERIMLMIAQQAAFVATIGYCLGIGLASLFFAVSSPALTGGLRGMFMDPWIFGGTGTFILVVTFIGCYAGVRRVLNVDPAIVFRG